MKLKIKTGLFSMLIAVLGGSAELAVAQQAEAQTRTLEEVVVTARKREESLQDVPVAITAINEQVLQEAGINELSDIFDMTAGLVYNEADGNRSTAMLGMRGIKPFTDSAPTSQRISTFIDGMPMVGSQATIQFVDVAGVEVYRGPQSAVFGRSVFGGAINYTTRKPSHEELVGGVNAQFGQDGREALSGWVSAPLIEDKLAFSASVATDSYDGPGSVVSNDGFKMGARETQYISAALSFKPTDSITARLRYSKTDLDDGPAADYNIDPATDNNYIASPFPGPRAPLYYGELNFSDQPALTRNFCYGDDANETFGLYNCIKDPGWELERDRLEVEVDMDVLDGHNLTFRAFSSEDIVFNIDDQDNSDINTAGIYIIGMGDDTVINEDYVEAVWTSPDEASLRYTFGLSSYQYEYEIVEYFVHPSAGLNGNGTGPSVGTQNVDNVGVFAGLFYDMNDKTTISLEGRWQEDDISAGGADLASGVEPRVVTNTFLPRIALTYALTDETNLYTQVAKGVQPASVNAEAVQSLQRATAAGLDGLVVDGVTYDSAIPFLDAVLSVDEEELWNYELGLKGTYLDNRLNLNAALFMIDTKGYAEQGDLFYFPLGSDADAVLAALENLGTATANPLLEGLEATALRVTGNINIADLRTTGLELEADYLLNDHWQLQGQVTYLDSKFTNGCAPIGSNFGINDSTLSLPSGLSLDCTTIDGNDFPFVPKVQLYAAATYTTEILNGWNSFTRMDYRYASKQYIDWFQAGWLPATHQLNFRTGISKDNLRVELYVENLTDDRTPTGAAYAPARNEVRAITGVGNPAFNTGLNVAIAPPREVGLRFNYSF